MKRKKKEAVRLSSSFYGAATKAPELRAGVDLWPTIVEDTFGRGGAEIQRATIDAWQRAGLVVITTRKPKGDEHHLAVPIVSVRLTAEGVKRVRERQAREQVRMRAVQVA